MNCTSASSSSNSHRQSSSDAPKLHPVVYAPNGTERSCRIRKLPDKYIEPFTTLAWKNFGGGTIYGEFVVTLKRAGHLRSQSRKLRFCVRSDSNSNADRMDKWQYSLVASQDIDPQDFYLLCDIHGTPKRRDPGYVLSKYKDNLEGLEILASKTGKGKWMIRPRSREERAALYKARQGAQAAEELSRWRESASADLMARAYLESADENAARRAKAKVKKQTPPRTAITSTQRSTSSESVASMSAKKGPLTSITFVATNETATTLSKARKHSSLWGGGLLREKA